MDAPKLLRFRTVPAGLLVLLLFLAASTQGAGPPPQTADRPSEWNQAQRQAAFGQLTARLAAAQAAGDEDEVVRLARMGQDVLGELAGIPEQPDEFRAVPAESTPLGRDEIARAFEPYRAMVAERRWWYEGLDPRTTPHLPREAASVLSGCLAARRAGCAAGDELLAAARQAGDYLLWTQRQAGRGVFPFPAVRNGSGRVFEVSERFLRRAEQSGKLDQVLSGGWAVDDLGDGGLQFDNGLCGVAVLELYEATGEPRYLKAAEEASRWAMARAPVPNWNYNSFSIYLLARMFGVSGTRSYLESACQKARLGLYPGQLRQGPYRGRWADPHNARPAYHYIMVRALAALVEAMPPDHADRAAAIDCLRLALLARNGDFAERGLPNVDSASEALARVAALPPGVIRQLGNCGVADALNAIDGYAAAAYRSRRAALSPEAWGRLLERLAKQ